MYHHCSYRLLGTSVIEDATTIQDLADVQRRLNITLPPSVDEWYRRGDAISVLLKHSNDDRPIALADFNRVT